MRGIRLASALALVWGMSGCDIFLANQPPGNLVVVVVDGTGMPMAGVTVSVELKGAPASRASKGAKTTDPSGQAEFRNLDSNQYYVRIHDLPDYPLFAETEAVVFVPEDGEVAYEFRALADGTIEVGVYANISVSALVELLDPSGDLVAVDRTETQTALRSGRVVFSGLRRGMYELRISEWPDWTEFEETTQAVNLVLYEEFGTSFSGKYIGERILRMHVTVDGVGLEGVEIEAEVPNNGNPVWWQGVTDSDGYAQRVYFASFADVVISGFDETRYLFPTTVQRVQLPYPPGVTTVEFAGTLLGSAPAVGINSPLSGDRFLEGRTVVFTGAATDQNDGTLPEGALEWASDRDGILGTGTEVRRSDLSVGTHLITLAATDSDGETSVASVQITIEADQPPTAQILAPTDGARLTKGDRVAFQGSGPDPEDGPLSGPALVWTSDRDGPIGTDEFFTTSQLSSGAHVITLTATDSRGATATASITIDIRPNAAPTPTITSPSDGQGFIVGEVVTFIGSADDAEDGSLSGASLIWTSDRDGTIGAGTTFSRADLSIGMHVVTLTATDRHGASASASVTVAVNTRPVVSITRPDISIYLFGETVLFEGTAVDAEDGTLSGASMVWTTSLDGVIGTGMSFSRSDLRVGSHVITLTATDSDGASSSVSKTLLIQGSGDATINGRVEVPGAGIGGVTVTATGPMATSTITDANGNYTLTGLAPGTYTLAISNVPPWASFDTTSIVVTLAAGQTVSITFTGSGG